MAGDNVNSYKPWQVPAGTYTLQAIPYDRNGGGGLAGTSLMKNITIKDATQPLDCHGDLGGTAFIDDCGVCAGGNTGRLANADKDACGDVLW
ncbi:MAG: hypothetical protein U5L96_14380 [Owenweeksia sp.]|nr:hypothetical protein [Owenweeksia sp.]